MKKGLSINVLAGILDILGAIIYFFAMFIIIVGSLGTKDGSGGGTAATIFIVFAVISLIVHIIALIQSKKAQLKTSGHIIGIIGHALYAVLGALLGIPAMVLCIIAAVFTLKNNKIETKEFVAQ